MEAARKGPNFGWSVSNRSIKLLASLVGGMRATVGGAETCAAEVRVAPLKTQDASFNLVLVDSVRDKSNRSIASPPAASICDACVCVRSTDAATGNTIMTDSILPWAG